MTDNGRLAQSFSDKLFIDIREFVLNNSRPQPEYIINKLRTIFIHLFDEGANYRLAFFVETVSRVLITLEINNLLTTKWLIFLTASVVPSRLDPDNKLIDRLRREMEQSSTSTHTRFLDFHSQN